MPEPKKLVHKLIAGGTKCSQVQLMLFHYLSLLGTTIFRITLDDTVDINIHPQTNIKVAGIYTG